MFKVVLIIQATSGVFLLKLDQTEKVEILKTEHRFAFFPELLRSKLKKWGLGNV